MKKIFLSLSVFLLLSCNCPTENVNFREEMINFVAEISEKAKAENENFIIIPQNGHKIIASKNNKIPQGELSNSAKKYLNSIDGVGRESLFYGYPKDGKPTKTEEKTNFLTWCDFYKNHSKTILVTDYFTKKSSISEINESYKLNNQKGYLSFASTNRLLTNIPNKPEKPYKMNNENITKLSEAKNFLYLINDSDFKNKKEMLDSIRETAYDLIIIDLFFWEGKLSAEDVDSLKIKGDSDGNLSTNTNGAKRLVICYISIGEAEDYRYYWKKDWKLKRPCWLKRENLNWGGNYKVKYWHKEWKDIILKKDEGYLYKILNSNFDGVYLDIIDAYEYFEK